MRFAFTPADITNIEKFLGVSARKLGPLYRFELSPADPMRKLALEITPRVPVGTGTATLVCVYTPGTHVQLHACSGYVVSDSLGQVTFVGVHEGKVSGLIVEREGGCSLYANVERAILSADFMKLAPEVMPAAVALSLTDTLLETPAPRTRTPARKKPPSPTRRRRTRR
jgi:hypothetical protein